MCLLPQTHPPTCPSRWVEVEGLEGAVKGACGVAAVHLVDGTQGCCCASVVEGVNGEGGG